jgi:hypothetical protein
MEFTAAAKTADVCEAASRRQNLAPVPNASQYPRRAKRPSLSRRLAFISVFWKAACCVPAETRGYLRVDGNCLGENRPVSSESDGCAPPTLPSSQRAPHARSLQIEQSAAIEDGHSAHPCRRCSRKACRRNVITFTGHEDGAAVTLPSGHPHPAGCAAVRECEPLARGHTEGAEENSTRRPSTIRKVDSLCQNDSRVFGLRG